MGYPLLGGIMNPVENGPIPDLLIAPSTKFKWKRHWKPLEAMEAMEAMEALGGRTMEGLWKDYGSIIEQSNKLRNVGVGQNQTSATPFCPVD